MRAVYASSAGAFGFVSLMRLLGRPRKVSAAKSVQVKGAQAKSAQVKGARSTGMKQR
jgi:hypothetical protein